MKERLGPRSTNQSTSRMEASRRGLRRWLFVPPLHPLRGPGEVIHEMVNSARTTSEVEQEIRTHHSPAQSGSPAYGSVRIGDVQYALLDEVNDFTVQRSLKAVGDVANDLFANMNRFLANRFVKGERTLDSFRRCFFARDYFNERHHVRRIEGMADDATFGMLTGGLHRTHRQSGGTRCDDRIRPSRRIYVSEKLDLEVLSFGPVLLDKVGIRERLLEVRCELQVIARRVLGKANDGEVFPGGVDVTAQVGFGVGCRIRCGNVETARKVECCPARADDSCSYDCYVANLSAICHIFLLVKLNSSKFLRTHLVAAAAPTGASAERVSLSDP